LMREVYRKSSEKSERLGRSRPISRELKKEYTREHKVMSFETRQFKHQYCGDIFVVVSNMQSNVYIYSSMPIYYTFANNFQLLRFILAISARSVLRRMVPPLNPTTPSKEPLSAFRRPPAIGVPVRPLNCQPALIEG
jgi:hypothetical protein